MISKSLINCESSPASAQTNAKQWHVQCMFSIFSHSGRFLNFAATPFYLPHSMQRSMNLPLENPPPLIVQASPPENENFWSPPNLNNSSDLGFLSISMSLCKLLRSQKEHNAPYGCIL